MKIKCIFPLILTIVLCSYISGIRAICSKKIINLNLKKFKQVCEDKVVVLFTGINYCINQIYFWNTCNLQLKRKKEKR